MFSQRSDAYGTQKWKHFRRFEVIIRLVKLFKIFGRRVSRSLTFCLETKMSWRQTPSRKKKAIVFTTVTTSAYQDKLNAGFSKVCEIFKVCGIESLNCVREFYTPVCYCGDIFTPETWRWTKRTVIGCLTCRSNGLMGGPWPMKAAMDSRPSAISLRETIENITFCSLFTNRLRTFRDFNHHTVTSINHPILFSSETWDAALSSLSLSVFCACNDFCVFLWQF